MEQCSAVPTRSATASVIARAVGGRQRLHSCFCDTWSFACHAATWHVRSRQRRHCTATAQLPSAISCLPRRFWASLGSTLDVLGRLPTSTSCQSLRQLLRRHCRLVPITCRYILCLRSHHRLAHDKTRQDGRRDGFMHGRLTTRGRGRHERFRVPAPDHSSSVYSCRAH